MEAQYRINAQSWLEGNFDEETKNQVRELMAGDEAALEDAFYRNLEFGTGGLRGVMGVGTNRMNKYVVGMATQGLANYIKKNVKRDNLSVSISYDSRNHSEEFARISADILAANGLDVYLFESLRPTPELSYAIRSNKSIAGIMVTASHNPGSYIGLKLMAQDVFPLAYGCGKEGGIKKIKEIYLSGPTLIEGEKKGSLEVINYLDDYISYSMELSGVKEGDLKGQKILLEFLNGSAGSEVALAFQKAGAEVDLMDVIPDGNFPKGDPNPIIETSIAPTRKAMKEGEYDYGFCFDGDGDRLDLMYRDGTQIVPGLNMALIADSVMKIFNGEKKDFYADVKAIPTSLALMAKSGAKIHIIRNGHSFIKAKLRENCDKGYFASEEESARYYMNFPYDIKD